MAAKVPIATAATDGFVVPGLGVYGGVQTTTNNLLTDVNEHHSNRLGLKFGFYYFGPSSSANDIDTGDTWTSNISGVVASAWQAADPTDDKVTSALTTAATGIFTFTSQNTNNQGWLWVLSSS